MMLTLAEQAKHLQEVSRTFALTIPLFPELLADCIANAYLLCRIADTIEDDPFTDAAHKIHWLTDFGQFCSLNFKNKDQLVNLHKQGCELVKNGAQPAEFALMQDLPRVVARTLSYPEDYSCIIARGVAILSYGMAQSVAGTRISTLDDVDHYCYAVAGVVGETLACLFAAYDQKIAKNKLLDLSVSFGEGLQLTNILKDRFTDQKRDACFLPPECFSNQDLLLRYLAITQGHLTDALEFVKTIPAKDYGMRQFCLLNIVMAAATLQCIMQDPQQENAKIKRQQVKKLYILCKFCATSNFLSTWLFRSISRKLPCEQRDPIELKNKVSLWDCDLNSLIAATQAQA